METIDVVSPGLGPWAIIPLLLAGIIFCIGLLLHFSKWKDSDSKMKRRLGEANGPVIGYAILLIIVFAFGASEAMADGLQDAKIEALKDKGYTHVISTGDNSFVASDDGRYVVIDLLDGDGGEGSYRVAVETPDQP